MERVSKTTFIAQANRKIEIYQSFIKAMEILKGIVPKYDNKKMDKRFIDKVNAVFAEKVPYTTIHFSTTYWGERENRFKLYYNNRYIESIGAYVDMYACESTICSRKGWYINNETFRLCSDDLIENLDCECEIYNKKVIELKESIDKIDEVIAKYAELEKTVETTLKSIPSPLRGSIHIPCPIYS